MKCPPESFQSPRPSPNKIRKVEFDMPSGVIPKSAVKHQKESRAEKSEKKVVDKAPDAAYIDLQKQLDSLSPSQLKIIGVMDEPSIHVDTVIDRSGLAPAKVLADLTLLQIKGYVRQETGKRFTLNIKMK